MVKVAIFSREAVAVVVERTVGAALIAVLTDAFATVLAAVLIELVAVACNKPAATKQATIKQAVAKQEHIT